MRLAGDDPLDLRPRPVSETVEELRDALGEAEAHLETMGDAEQEFIRRVRAALDRYDEAGRV